MISAFALSLSLSMGELGATMMISPTELDDAAGHYLQPDRSRQHRQRRDADHDPVAATLLLMLVLERIAQRLTPGAIARRCHGSALFIEAKG